MRRSPTACIGNNKNYMYVGANQNMLVFVLYAQLIKGSCTAR